MKEGATRKISRQHSAESDGETPRRRRLGIQHDERLVALRLGSMNHNETLVVLGRRLSMNHSETLIVRRPEA